MNSPLKSPTNSNHSPRKYRRMRKNKRSVKLKEGEKRELSAPKCALKNALDQKNIAEDELMSDLERYFVSFKKSVIQMQELFQSDRKPFFIREIKNQEPNDEESNQSKKLTYRRRNSRVLKSATVKPRRKNHSGNLKRIIKTNFRISPKLK